MNLKELHKKLKSHLDFEKESWNSFVYGEEDFYQGFEKIEITGCRPTEKRFSRYNIEDFLSLDKTALDIGSNCGFLTLHLSNYLKSIDGVEINPFLVSIANDTKDFLSAKNAVFFNSSFENFLLTKKYDVIFSFANDSTIDGNTKFNFISYINKILDLLVDNGLLIFESQAQDSISDETFSPKRKIINDYFDILLDKRVKSEYPYNVKERFFLVLQKKSGRNKITNSLMKFFKFSKI